MTGMVGILLHEERNKKEGIVILNDFQGFPIGNYTEATFLHNQASSAEQIFIRDALTWDVLDWLHSVTPLPIIVKGILTAEDARLAVERGVAGIIVSNHGGRRLDAALPSLEALPEVVEAVAGKCEVYLDGGIRRGTDVLKALALGAQAVLVGRPILWELAVDGQEDVQRVLEILRREVECAMALAGCPTVESINRSLIRPVRT